MVYQGRHIAQDRIITVTDAVYEIYGPGGSSHLAYIERVAVDPVEVNATRGAQVLANQEGVDLTKIKGTGLDGRITKDDVRRWVG